MPLVSVPEQNDVAERRHAQRPSSPELWELKQMAAANVIDVSELPGFDEETGLLQNDDDSGNDRGLKAKCWLFLCFMSHSVARYGHKETRVGLCSFPKASISLA